MKKLLAPLLILVLFLSTIQATYAIDGLSVWTQTNTDYFGDSENSNADDMIVYNGKIYISQFNSTTGVEIWEYNGTTWSQSNTDGFGDSENAGTDNFIVHNSKLYVGTTSNSTGVEVWEFNGTAWAQVNTDGFGDALNTRISNDMVIYNSKLIAGAKNGAGIELWEYSDAGTSWTMINTNGFGNASNLDLYDMAEYNSKLYVATYQNGGAAEIWTCTTCDGSDWAQTSTDGFGDANNTRIQKFIVYNSKLYVPARNTSTGTEIWELDVASWSQVNTDGFGDANNDSIENSFLYGGNVYFATSNWTTGTEVWEYNGTTWAQVNTNGFGDANNTDFTSSIEYNGDLYGGVYNYVTGVEMWRCSTCDGTDWTQVNEEGFGGGLDPWGDAENAGITANIALLGSSIHVASGTWSYTPRTWEAHIASTDLELTKTIDNASPEVSDVITYTLTVTNNGPDGATEVEVTDSLPTGATYSADTPSQGTYTSGTGIWDVGTVLNGNTATLAIDATVTASVSDTVTNSAEITAAAEADPDSTVNNDQIAEDDQDTVDFTVIASTSADLTITNLTVDNQAPSTGDTITYTLKVKNNGPDDATNIQVTNTLPSGLSYGNTAPTQGTFLTATGIWAVGGLASGSEATLMFDAVVGASGGTSFTDSAEVTSVTEADPDSTPNNAVTTEDDYASVQGTVAAAPTGGSNYTPSGGGSSSTKETLSGEEEAEEPEEVVEEEVVEEPVEEEPAPPVEPIEEELPTDTVIEYIVEPVYEYFVEPTPPAPAPPAYQPPPTPPAPPVQEGLLDDAMVSNAIDLYLQEPIPEPKEKPEYDPETVKSDVDGDRLSDAFAAANDLPLGEIDPDGDSYSNEKEIYCGTDPLEADELNPKVSNLERVTSGSTPAFRLCAATPGDSYEIYLVDQESEDQMLLGSTIIGDDNRGVFVPGTPIQDGSYYILAKNADEEELHVSSFTVSDSDAPTAPGIQLVAGTGGSSDLGRTVRLVIEFNGDIYTFDSERFIASGATQAYIKGSSGPRLIAYATWQSRILGSVVISDASTGEFELEIPSDLLPGEHEILVYVMDEENNLVSSVTSFIFTR